MSRPYAFTFWHAIDETPGYIDLCLATQRRNLGEAFEHVHLDLESAKEWVPEHELLWEMSEPEGHGRSVSVAGRRVALYSGMLRVALLRRHGGLWIDADTILFPQFSLLAELIDEYDLLLGESSGGKVSNAILGGRPESPAIAAYWQAIQQRIAEKRASGHVGARWGEFGFRMLRTTLLESGGAGAWVAPWGVLDTIDAHIPRPTFVPGATIEQSLSPHALDVSIFNNATEADVRKRSADDLLSEDTLLSSAYRVAMGETDCPHLNIRTAAQLRTLNRADLIVRRMAHSDRVTHGLVARTDALRERLETTVARRDKLSARLDLRTKQRDELRLRLHQRTERLERMTARLQGLSERLDGTTARLRQRNDELKDVRGRLRDRRHEIAELHAQIEDLRRPFPRLRALLRRLRR